MYTLMQSEVWWWLFGLKDWAGVAIDMPKLSIAQHLDAAFSHFTLYVRKQQCCQVIAAFAMVFSGDAQTKLKTHSGIVMKSRQLFSVQTTLFKKNKWKKRNKSKMTF